MAQSSPAPPALDDARHRAAQASGGTSHEAIYAALFRVLEEFRAEAPILDFGAGTGSLTRKLLAAGRFGNVTATDLMPQPRGLDVAWICADLNNSLPAPDASFQTIVAAEVIEHLENPRAIARELFRLLKPGGIAVISTPNNESWRSLISLAVRGHHIAFLDGSYPAHITALVRRDLTRILTEGGFEPPVFRYTDCGGIPGKPTVTWQKISAGGLRGLRFSDNLIAVARKPGERP